MKKAIIAAAIVAVIFGLLWASGTIGFGRPTVNIKANDYGFAASPRWPSHYKSEHSYDLQGHRREAWFKLAKSSAAALFVRGTDTITAFVAPQGTATYPLEIARYVHLYCDSVATARIVNNLPPTAVRIQRQLESLEDRHAVGVAAFNARMQQATDSLQAVADQRRIQLENAIAAEGTSPRAAVTIATAKRELVALSKRDIAAEAKAIATEADPATARYINHHPAVEKNRAERIAEATQFRVIFIR